MKGKTRRLVSLKEMERRQVEIHTDIEYNSITPEGDNIIEKGAERAYTAFIVFAYTLNQTHF